MEIWELSFDVILVSRLLLGCCCTVCQGPPPLIFEAVPIITPIDSNYTSSSRYNFVMTPIRLYWGPNYLLIYLGNFTLNITV